MCVSSCRAGSLWTGPCTDVNRIEPRPPMSLEKRDNPARFASHVSGQIVKLQGPHPFSQSISSKSSNTPSQNSNSALGATFLFAKALVLWRGTSARS